MSSQTSIADKTGRTEWIGRREIRRIEGALKPSAYVARAYKYARENDGAAPEWARKEPNGHWLFRADYVLADAELNRESLSVNEAAAILGVTRRAIQTWVDEGEIAVSGDTLRTKGEQRRIARMQFMEDLPRLRKRLETPAVIGYRTKHGKPLPAHILERAAQDRSDTRAAGQPETPTRPPTPKESIAAILESRLKQAMHKRTAEAAERPSKAEKEQVASAIEARLKDAKEAKLREQMWTHEAEAIAMKIMDDMFDNELSRIGAVMLFNKVAAGQNIPDTIRIRTRKKFFGK